MRFGGRALLVCAASTIGAPAAIPQTAPDRETLVLSADLRLKVVRGRQLVVEARAWPDESLAAFSGRLSAGDRAARLEAALRDSSGGEDGFVPVPLALLSDELRRFALTALFPADRADGEDWVHVARSGVLPTYDEGLPQVAEWFATDRDLFPELQRWNALPSPELALGTPVRIPGALLHPAFRSRARSEDGTLEYGTDDAGDYAGYRLRPGEALYSSVVLRFTGRTAREDVESVAVEIGRRSGVRDLTDIPVGWLVKIPLDLLEPDFLPSRHARRIEADAARAAVEAELRAAAVETEQRAAAAPRPKTLDGALVVLDPGHGGKDPGTMHNGLWEHDPVYDIALRVKRILERETGASVALTLLDPKTGTKPSTGDSLARAGQEAIQTNPPFVPGEDGESALGVNLRWYLANSLYRKAVAKGTPPERVVFVSIHADARHPDLRGLMVYVPGAAYRTKTYGSNSKTYRRYREVREKPLISFDKKERVRSEAVSRVLADRLVGSFRDEGLAVQPYLPVRHRVIRGRQDWLPAVLRGNEIPAKVLAEVVNLTNAKDARILATAADRERIANALARGIRRYLEKGAS